MEVSGQDLDSHQRDEEAEGKNLIQQVTTLTQLPEDWIQTEIHQLLDQSGHDRETVTLEELRSSLLSYLESMQDHFLPEDEDLEQKN